MDEYDIEIQKRFIGWVTRLKGFDGLDFGIRLLFWRLRRDSAISAAKKYADKYRKKNTWEKI